MLAPAKAGRLEIADVEHRVVGPQLGQDEGDGGQQGKEEEHVDPPGPVARGLAQDDAEGERAQGQGPEHEAGDVEPGPDRIGALGQHDRGADEGQRPEEDVEPEDGPPGPAVDQQAPDERSERQPEAGYRGPDAE